MCVCVCVCVYAHTNFSQRGYTSFLVVMKRHHHNFCFGGHVVVVAVATGLLLSGRFQYFCFLSVCIPNDVIRPWFCSHSKVLLGWSWTWSCTAAVNDIGEHRTLPPSVTTTTSPPIDRLLLFVAYDTVVFVCVLSTTTTATTTEEVLRHCRSIGRSLPLISPINADTVLSIAI